MGILNLFGKTKAPQLPRLPSGSFTLDRGGQVIACTLPQSFSPHAIREIGRHVLAAFRSAEAAQAPLGELTADYSSLKLTARELRGGAIVFLSPQGLPNK